MCWAGAVESVRNHRVAFWSTGLFVVIFALVLALAAKP
jgi:hypothetical protein